MRRHRARRKARSSCGAARRRRSSIATACRRSSRSIASKIKVQQSELGGGFGGKTGFYAEPVAIQLARKARRPVKITFTRAEVFKGTGPVSGTQSRIKIGCKKDGTITAADAELVFQTGPYSGSAFTNAPQAMFTRYDLQERAHGLLRGRLQPAEGRLVPRAVRAAGGVRRRRHHVGARRQDRHGRDRLPPEERDGRRRRRRSTRRRSARSASSRRCRPPRPATTTSRRCRRAAAAASRPASGSTAAARRPRRCRSRPTAR